MDADSRRFCFALRVSFKERNRDARTGILNLTNQISGPRINLRSSAVEVSESRQFVSIRGCFGPAFLQAWLAFSVNAAGVSQFLEG
jgi:hypothetical protein